jgi:hypothetical protein
MEGFSTLIDLEYLNLYLYEIVDITFNPWDSAVYPMTPVLKC